MTTPRSPKPIRPSRRRTKRCGPTIRPPAPGVLRPRRCVRSWYDRHLRRESPHQPLRWNRRSMVGMVVALGSPRMGCRDRGSRTRCPAESTVACNLVLGAATNREDARVTHPGLARRPLQIRPARLSPPPRHRRHRRRHLQPNRHRRTPPNPQLGRRISPAIAPVAPAIWMSGRPSLRTP